MSNSSRPPRAVRRFVGPAVAAVLAATALTGCGGDSDDEPTSTETGLVTLTPTPEPTEAATTAAPAPSPTPKPRPTRKPTKPSEGDGDADEVDEPAAGGGCAFTQRRAAPPSATVIDVPYAEMTNGMDGAKENATSTVEGQPQDVPGIGDAAFVVTGTSFGGDQVQGAGAVKVGDRLVSVNLAQSAGLKPARVKALVLALLRLAVDELD